MADEPAAASSPGSSVVAATDRIREAAKWTTVSLAALGSVLIAGSQLSDVGALDPTSDRFLLAAVGGAAAVVGILLILGVTVRTMATPVLTIGALATKNPSWIDKDENKSVLRGHDLSTIVDDYQGRITARNSAYDRYVNETDENRRKTLGTAFKLADSSLLALDKDITAILQVGQFYAVAFRWYVCFAVSVVGAVLAAAGIGLFAWASNPPEDAVASSASSNVLTTPTQGTARLLPEGRAALAKDLACDKTELSVLVLAKTAAGSDVLVQEEGCKSIRVLLGPMWGTVS